MPAVQPKYAMPRQCRFSGAAEDDAERRGAAPRYAFAVSFRAKAADAFYATPLLA